jgi:23S rRNA (uracil1939-C5)-methyltransferase
MSEANPMSEASPIDLSLRVDSLDLEGQGIARRPDGKVVFIEGALPGERVTVQVHRRKNQWEQGVMQALWQAAALRVTPRCPHFGLHAGACGGCKMQHLEPSAQVAAKQRVLEDNLWHLGKVKAETMLAPIHGPFWWYRQRARLSVRHVVKKGQVLIGFHERKSRYIADMHSCAILPPAISDLLLPLRELIAGMNARDTCPQIELACGDRVVALVLRHLEPLVESDRLRLRDFAHAHPGVQGLTPSICLTRAGRRWLILCQSSACGCRFDRPISPRSTLPSIRCWWGQPCVACKSSPLSV